MSQTEGVYAREKKPIKYGWSKKKIFGIVVVLVVAAGFAMSWYLTGNPLAIWQQLWHIVTVL
jgi:hypothetical protein